MDLFISNETKENLIKEINNKNHNGISEISSSSEGLNGEMHYVDDLLNIINTNHTNETPIWKLYTLSTLLLSILIIPSVS